MPYSHRGQHTIYVGMHDGVCTVSSTDGGQTWLQGPVTPLPHAVARLAVSPTQPQRAYLAAYEAGVYRSDDGGHLPLARWRGNVAGMRQLPRSAGGAAVVFPL